MMKFSFSENLIGFSQRQRKLQLKYPSAPNSSYSLIHLARIMIKQTHQFNFRFSQPVDDILFLDYYTYIYKSLTLE